MNSIYELYEDETDLCPVCRQPLGYTDQGDPQCEGCQTDPHWCQCAGAGSLAAVQRALEG